MIAWLALFRIGWSQRSSWTVPAPSMCCRKGIRWCRPVRVSTWACSPTTRSTVWRRSWWSQSRVTQGSPVQGGMDQLLMHYLIQHSSHFHGPCWGIHLHPISTWRSTMAMSSCFTGFFEDTGLTQISQCSSSSLTRSWSGRWMWAHPSSPW